MYPSQMADRFLVRLPEGMRDRIREAAIAAHRSMNSEIIYQLGRIYGPGEEAAGQGSKANSPAASSNRSGLASAGNVNHG